MDNFITAMIMMPLSCLLLVLLLHSLHLGQATKAHQAESCVSTHLMAIVYVSCTVQLVLSVAGLGILALVNQFILTSCPYSIYNRNLAMRSQSLLKSALTTPLEFKACSPDFTHPMQRYGYNLHPHTEGA